MPAAWHCGQACDAREKYACMLQDDLKQLCTTSEDDSDIMMGKNIECES